MPGFIGKVLATATGIAVYELAVRPLVADRFGARAAAQELSEDELDNELAESDAELAQLEAEVRAEGGDWRDTPRGRARLDREDDARMLAQAEADARVRASYKPASGRWEDYE